MRPCYLCCYMTWSNLCIFHDSYYHLQISVTLWGHLYKNSIEKILAQPWNRKKNQSNSFFQWDFFGTVLNLLMVLMLFVIAFHEGKHVHKVAQLLSAIFMENLFIRKTKPVNKLFESLKPMSRKLIGKPRILTILLSFFVLVLMYFCSIFPAVTHQRRRRQEQILQMVVLHRKHSPLPPWWLPQQLQPLQQRQQPWWGCKRDNNSNNNSSNSLRWTWMSTWTWTTSTHHR